MYCGTLLGGSSGRTRVSSRRVCRSGRRRRTTQPGGIGLSGSVRLLSAVLSRPRRPVLPLRVPVAFWRAAAASLPQDKRAGQQLEDRHPAAGCWPVVVESRNPPFRAARRRFYPWLPGHGVVGLRAEQRPVRDGLGSPRLPSSFPTKEGKDSGRSRQGNSESPRAGECQMSSEKERCPDCGSGSGPSSHAAPAAKTSS